MRDDIPNWAGGPIIRWLRRPWKQCWFSAVVQKWTTIFWRLQKSLQWKKPDFVTKNKGFIIILATVEQADFTIFEMKYKILSKFMQLILNIWQIYRQKFQTDRINLRLIQRKLNIHNMANMNYLNVPLPFHKMLKFTIVWLSMEKQCNIWKKVFCILRMSQTNQIKNQTM